MKILTKTFGVILGIVSVISYGTLLFVISKTRFTINELLAYSVVITLWHLLVHFLFLVRFGFPYDENVKRSRFIVNAVPITLTMVVLTYTVYCYQQDERKNISYEDIQRKMKSREELRKDLVGKRDSIAQLSDLSLRDKIDLMEFYRYLNPRSRIVDESEFEKILPIKRYSLSEYFNNFQFKTGNLITTADSIGKTDGNFYVADADNGQTIRVRISERNQLLGCIDQSLLVFTEQTEDGKFAYYSRDLKTANLIEGIPLFANPQKIFYSNVWLSKSKKGVSLNIALWHSMGNERFQVLSGESIPLWKNNDLEHTIENIFWSKESFYFTIQSLSRPSEKVNIEVSPNMW